ncbi:TetR family transcriptional regulator [Amycolatopsis sp. RM579]|uniref:TetR family transcriptional regulator n=2 Tax=Amycolatopsis pithecellobii TaxID=664692 RepID=A0A6N7YWN7_9PSEU|nr:TetR family transcriptional regulator [Amycolatopsis pithecellobii]
MRADARRNYERILSVAREAFTEHGPDAPLDDIARRAQVGPGTLYRHFPNREALIEAVYRADIEARTQRTTELLETLPPGEAFEEWMRGYVEAVRGNRSLATTLKAAMDHDSETFALCKKMLHDAAAKIVRAAQDGGVIRDDVTPRDLLLMVHAIGVAAEATPDAAPRLLTVMLDGLRRQEP